MKKFNQIYSSEIVEQLSKHILDEPILKFGYPKLDEEDDDTDSDDEPDLSFLQNLGPKNPFNAISANLYNLDYQNRIIVINEDIDQKCFIYAKMIENWNREDRKIYELKDRIKKLIKKDSKIEMFFNGLKLEDVDDVDMDAKQKEISKKFDEFIDKYPEFRAILADLNTAKMSNLSILNYNPLPIKIKFNSRGGWLVAYQTLSDVITLSKTKVIGINMGMAYSAAAFLLISCHERLALPKSRILVHRGSGGNFGSYEQTESAQENYKEEVNDMIEAFMKRTKIPKHILEKKMTPDWYLSAEKARHYGMIDRIVTDIDELL